MFAPSQGVGISVSFCLVLLTLTVQACEMHLAEAGNDEPAAEPLPEAASPTPTPTPHAADLPGAASPAPPATTSDLQSSVTVYVKLLIKKDYGLLATASGRRDSTERSEPYDIDNQWWNNPLVAFRDPALATVDVTGGDDADPIAGKGASRNVEIELTLVPHADVAVHTTPPSDAIAATITMNLVAAASYFDGRWTQMLKTEPKTITFTIDTRDPSRRSEVIATDKRTMPVLSIERYIRKREKWEPAANWPKAAESGDWYTRIYGTDAQVNVTAYRYAR